MSARFFMDSNILLYGFDKTDFRKKVIAEKLVEQALEKGSGVISYQVCQEFCNVLLHKIEPRISVADLADYLEAVVFRLIAIHSSAALFREALRIHQETQYRFYDCLIVAAALEAGVSILYSEDLQEGRRFGEMEVVNPFRE